ncbi:PEGA domain-containing protein [Haliangium sp.]|uniref:PEGA domain-containing protein n=1 Tax=Haliangium sp. TaxID=2663208 RepID=UPI003D13E42E
MLRFTTRVDSLDALVSTFSNLIDKNTLFIVTKNMLPVGLRRRFVVTLRDGQPALSGEGEIEESPAQLSGPGSATGVRLRLLKLTPGSRALHARMLDYKREHGETQVSPMPKPPPPGSTESEVALAEADPAPKPPPKEAVEQAGFVLPANPLSELAESSLQAFVECTIFEDYGVPRFDTADLDSPSPIESEETLPNNKNEGDDAPPPATTTPAQADSQPPGPDNAPARADSRPPRPADVPARLGTPPPLSNSIGGARARSAGMPPGPEAPSRDAGPALVPPGPTTPPREVGPPRPRTPLPVQPPSPPGVPGPSREVGPPPRAATPPPLQPAPAPLGVGTPPPRGMSPPPPQAAAGPRTPLVLPLQAPPPARSTPTPPATAELPARSATVALGLKAQVVTAVLALGIGLLAGFWAFGTDTSKNTAESTTQAGGPEPATASSPDEGAAATSPPSEPDHVAEADDSASVAAAALGETDTDSEDPSNPETSEDPEDPDASEDPEALADSAEATTAETETSAMAQGASAQGCAITVQANVDAARVRIDGKRVGTGVVRERPIPCGKELLVRVEHPRYEIFEKRITASAGKPMRIAVSLQRPSARLTLVSDPPGATLSVNGRVIGRSPATVDVKAYRSIYVKATLRGYKSWTRRVRVSKPKQTITASLDRAPDFGGR